MIRDHILLTHIVTMIEKNIADIENSGNILSKLHASAGEAMLNRVNNDLHDIRRELKRRDIRILSEEQSKMVVNHGIHCRGYTEEFGMTREVMRAEISVMLTRYTAEFGALLREFPK